MTFAPLVSLLLAVGFSWLLVATAPADRGDASGATRATRVWPSASAAVLLVYASQELLQASTGAGHAAGLHGAFGHGGWIVVPLAIVVGAIIAATVQTVRALERRAGLAAFVRVQWPIAATVLLSAEIATRARSIVGSHLAGRGPPSLVV